MTTRAARLSSLCRDLGVAEEDVLRAEGLNRFHLDAECDGSVVGGIPLARLAELASAYPGAIEVELSAGAWATPLIAAGIVAPGAGANLNKALGLARCNLRIEIDKAQLAATAVVTGDCHILHYIFLDALSRLLAGLLPVVDEALFADRYRPTLVVVSSAPEIDWEGPLLTVAGEAAVARDGFAERLGQRCELATQARQRRRLDDYHETAASALSWIGFRLRRVTPVHFLGEALAGDETARVDAALGRQVVHAVVVFTAQRSQYEDWTEDGERRDRLAAYYENEEQLIAIELGEREPDPSAGNLARLALWPYGGAGRDRLIVFGKVVARTLEPSSPDEPATKHRNYGTFLDQTARLLSDAAWSYRTLVGRRIDHHFAAIRRAEENAAEVARAMSEKLDTVTRGLSESLLTTVGVVVLTLLAAAVENGSGGQLFQLAMWAYAGYLVVFPLCYRMGSLFHGYLLTRDEWEATRSTIGTVLSPSTLNRIESTVERRDAQFRTWFWITVGLYLLIAVLICALPYSILDLID